MNITVSQLIMSIYGVPVDLVAALQLGWKLGESFCLITGFLLTFIGMYIINMFTSIAVYRWMFAIENVSPILPIQAKSNAAEVPVLVRQKAGGDDDDHCQSVLEQCHGSAPAAWLGQLQTRGEWNEVKCSSYLACKLSLSKFSAVLPHGKIQTTSATTCSCSAWASCCP